MLSPARTEARSLAPDGLSLRSIAIPAEVWIVAALTVLAGVLRFATIATQSYWLDEALTVHEMHLSFGALIGAMKSTETTPPLYFVIAWLWVKIFGVGEAGLRSLSALAGTAVVPLMYLCGRTLISRRAGLIAAALAAVSPFMIWYSQEARAYMLLAALSAASLLFFARAWRDPSGRNMAWWAVFSALALATHFFAGFLVAPEALWLLYTARNRSSILAAGAVAAMQLALVPLAVGDSAHSLNWIKAFPLSIRIEQVPTQFALGSLYQSSLVNYGLLGAAVLAAIVVFLLVAGAPGSQLRGAGVAALVAAFALLVPLALTKLGQDYFLARNLMPAWIPLVVLVAAACAAPRMRLIGGVLAGALLVSFVLASIRVNDHPQYQRLDWRGVAAVLGKPSGPRAIVAYDGVDAAWPLAIYLPGVPWTESATLPVTVGEIDVVGSAWQTPAKAPPPGVRLISDREVDGFRVERFTIASPWHLNPVAIGARADALLTPARPDPAVLIQST